ncbi:MAG: flagellar biosynthetic protein FliO [Limnohabitans sp.]|jgi:flagellar protein FliO/FliZ
MGTWEIVKMLASLVLVLVLMIGLIWALRRLQHKLQAGADPTRQIRLLETLSVGPRQKILLMEVDGQRVLVGVTAQQMQSLGQWPADASTSPARPESLPHA